MPGLRSLILYLLIAIVTLTGCTRSPTGLVSEQEETAFRRGKQRLREGRPDEALQSFLTVIERRHQAPESHLESGLLYLNRFSEPVLAIYHFNEYLRQKPGSEQADRVKQLITTAKKEFARSLPAAPFGGEVDKLDLKELLEKTRAENESLKTELSKVREELERYKTVEQARLDLEKNLPVPMGTGGVALSTSENKVENKPALRSSEKGSTASSRSNKPKTYAVQEGDTLSSIAKKFYGASSRWKDVYEANRKILPSPKSLKIGQTLNIP